MQKDEPNPSNSDPTHKALETEMQQLTPASPYKDVIPSSKSKKDEDLDDVDKALKKNLMFEEKNISIFRICIHLSYTPEYIFMLLGVIGSIGNGVPLPLMALLTGEAIGTFADTFEDNMSTLTPSERLKLYSLFNHDAKKQSTNSCT